MKKTQKLFISVVTLLSITLSTTSFALETKNFDGYYGGESEGQISISNIIGPDNYLNSNPDVTEAYTCQSPVTITTLVDDLVIFEAKQMAPVAGALYYVDKQFPVAGNVRYHNEEATIAPWSPDLEFMSYSFKKDCKITLTKPGLYHVLGRFEAMGGSVSIDLNIVGDVVPTASKIYVDGKEMEFEAYNIDDNNHFKLRDVAKAINGSQKQFEVTWDEEKRAINLVSNAPYTEVGGELTLGDGTVKKAQAATADIYINDEAAGFTAYTINDNNYFELRDLGKIFNFDVSWDPDTKSILIETDKDYTED